MMANDPPTPPGAEPPMAGVDFGRLDRIEDQRGAFREVWRASVSAPDRFVQANLSSSVAGVLRGLHLHERQLDRWLVVAGRAFVALVDVRPMLRRVDPASRPVVTSRVLERDDWVVIPSGVAHGFLALEPLELLYLVTNEYDGTDEHGFAWDDPEAAVAWPVLDTVDGRPILSDRDLANPSLLELVERLRR
jgi:dTDP-4-dehydrorhamnose 3,5-epimerase